MAARTLDELKTIKKDLNESAIRKSIIDFFDVMDVNDVDKRTLTAISLERIFREMFLAALTGELAREELIDRLITEYSMIIVASGYRANYEHIERVCTDIVDNTLKDIDKPYMTSPERSIIIAETETNNAANYDGYAEAKANGLTEKVWIAHHDNRTRQTHMEVDGTAVGIDELFQVGMAELRFPCDEEYGYNNPEEVVNCRCHLEFQ